VMHAEVLGDCPGAFASLKAAAGLGLLMIV
jgi:hypothetical protein